MIEVRQVDKLFHTQEGIFQALRGVDLSVRNAEIFGIIGRSGAGKSTLLRILNLLERPSAGSVSIDGQSITELSAAQMRRLRQRIGMVFQHFNLLSACTVEENVRLPLRIAGELSFHDQWKRVNEVLQLVGLSDLRRKYPRQLSGGQRQRVGIARAIANSPKLLLCDEATSALDPETTQSILGLLRDINQRLQLTIVLITHGMDVIRAVADRVAVLDHGQVVEQGEVLDVFLAPRHATTRALLEEIGMETADPAAQREVGNDPAPETHSQVWRLAYRGAAVTTPVLTSTAREHKLDITLLQGTVGHIKDMPYAQLTVRVFGKAADLAHFSDSLTRREVHCERLS